MLLQNPPQRNPPDHLVLSHGGVGALPGAAWLPAL